MTSCFCLLDLIPYPCFRSTLPAGSTIRSQAFYASSFCSTFLSSCFSLTLISHIHHAGSGEEPGNVTKTKHSCSVEGAVYSKCGGGCPLTCGNPYILCLIQGCFPGCMCPDGQLIDEVKKRCVPQDQCPSPGVEASDNVCIAYTV